MDAQAKKAIGFYFAIQNVLFLVIIFNNINTIGLQNTISNPQSLVLVVLFLYSLYIQVTCLKNSSK